MAFAQTSLKTALPTSRTLAGQRPTTCQPAARAPFSFRVCAATETDEGPKLSFKSNSRSAVGYTEEDSAGQTNIFAVEPKQYVQGSSRDTTADAAAQQANLITTAALVGAAVLILGVASNSQNSDAGPSNSGESFASLSSYSQEFSSSSAPALSD